MHKNVKCVLLRALRDFLYRGRCMDYLGEVGSLLLHEQKEYYVNHMKKPLLTFLATAVHSLLLFSCSKNRLFYWSTVIQPVVESPLALAKW